MDFANTWGIIGIYKRLFGWRRRCSCCNDVANSTFFAPKKCPSNGTVGNFAFNGGFRSGVSRQGNGTVATNFVGNGGCGRRRYRRSIVAFQTKKRRYQNYLFRGADTWRYQNAVLVDTSTIPTPMLCNCRHKRRHCGLLGVRRWARKKISPSTTAKPLHHIVERGLSPPLLPQI